MTGLKNLEKVHQDARSKLEPYVLELVKLLGEDIRSVVVYGSALGPDYVPGKSNINLLVVCQEVGLDTLKKAVKLVKKGRKKGIVAPLFLTVEHMKTSSDVFPIEFLEMRDQHVVIYGEEFLDKLDIGFENLRLECEEQLKGKLIRLRQAYLEVGSDAKELLSVLSESISSIVPVFRGVLRLLGGEPPLGKKRVIEALSSELDMELKATRRVLEVKLEGLKVRGPELEALYGGYLDELERVAIAVDRLHGKKD